jgi:hypothetical protein
MPQFHVALVLAERNVSYPVEAVLDAPVTAPMGKQKGRVGPLARETADGVLDFDRGPTLTPGRAFQTASLRQARPIKMPGQPSAGLQMPLYGAAVAL